MKQKSVSYFFLFLILFVQMCAAKRPSYRGLLRKYQPTQQHVSSTSPFYICTSADSGFFSHLINLINSLHKFNFDQIGQIAVFDLGFTRKQIQELKSIKKVSVYKVELTHPDLLKYFRCNNNGRMRRGWYAWKPVVMKQALDMFPYILYMDAGLMILKPLDELFRHIHCHGYLFAGCGHSIKWMTPQHVIKTFDLPAEDRCWILDESTEGVSGGFMGLTKNMYDSFLLPVYKLSYDIRHFVDDGTTPNGFGTARHDQVLFSIQARLLGLDVPSWYTQGRVLINGARKPCLCRDIVIRMAHVVDLSSYNRQYIRYIRG